MKFGRRKTISLYWEATWKYKMPVLFSIAGIVGAAVANVIVPLYFKDFFNLLTGSSAPDDIAPHLISILLAIAVLEMANWACWRVATFTASYFQPKVMLDLANTCFSYLHQHSFRFFNDNFVGSLVKKVKWFGRSYEVISDRILWNLTPLFVNIGVIAFVLFRRDVWLGSGIVCWVILFLVLNGFFVRFKMKYDLRRSAAETETTGLLADTIANQGTVKLFNGLPREARSFDRASEALRKLRRITWDLGNVFEALQGVLMVGLEIGIFYLAIRLWQRGILTIGDFVLIQAYLINIFSRLWDFGKVIRQIYEHLADAEEMAVILETPHEIKDRPGATALRVVEGAISFRHVDFFYNQTRPVLKKFNLDIKPREHVAVVGPSGAGKSTLVRLLLRIHEIDGGKILVDGQDIHDITQQSLRQAISLVPQDPVLFHRSILENIRYSNPSVSDAAVIEAAKRAHCHEFISNLSDGYQTYVGERGVKLSSGERQRVAIARAILSSAPILVLDEATSSLDSESERMIQDALEGLIAGRTVIAIAHRLSTIRKMDRIVVIDQGGIVEQGSHAALMRTAGVYRRLWELQAGGFIQ
ncbi:MAG: ABC transporter ATP-binding protein [Patescibacteria group bacterium]|nr:ABC transporter ATP-binding protein [Patescibacteria group bacterium]MDD5715797.1 ABC transporter ATP-binding protein [Patescibacteria group bacterium]